MTDWTSGYVADIGYTYGYYPELNPLRLRLAFLSTGLAFPQCGTACELGFGQGVSANMHASASSVQWFGTDFNPSQAGFAQELALVSNSGAKLYDEAFADFCNRVDLPDFDFIGIHGIWSWISDENRKVIADFIRRKLKVGGVLYISYNTLPGWGAFAPMRHLMTEHAEIIGAEGHGIVNRINGALEFTERFLATNPTYARANPQIAERIGKIKDQNRHYLAHEYFNRDWYPMHFADMAKWLSSAKLSYACSAHYLDHLDVVNLSPAQQAFMKEIPDPMFRETVRDFMINQQFRRDYWIKGARKLTPLEQAEALRAEKIILVTPRSKVSLKVTGSLHEANLSEAVYAPILDVLADHRPRTLGELERALHGRSVNFAQVLQAIVTLVGTGHIGMVQKEAEIAQAKIRTDKLNLYLMNKARSSGDMGYLASPVTGGGITVGRFVQMFLLASLQGKKTPAEWARFVWQILNKQGQTILKDGCTLTSEKENLEELERQANEFAEMQLGVLKALQVI